MYEHYQKKSALSAEHHYNRLNLEATSSRRWTLKLKFRTKSWLSF